MVGCKDNPARILNSRSLASLPSSLDVNYTLITPWLRALPQTLPTPTITLDSPSTKQLTEQVASTASTIVRSNLEDLIRPPADVPSLKRKALVDLDPFIPRKSSRLKQRQSALGKEMPSSSFKKKETGNHAKGGAKNDIEKDDANVSAGGTDTRGRSHVKVYVASSSDKENTDTVKSAIAPFSVIDGIGSITQIIPPAPSLISTQLGSPSLRKPSSSRPTSSTKSSSTKGSKAIATVDKRQRLSALNPPVTFHTPAYLGTLGKKIPPSVRSLWVGLQSDDEGFIPEALKARVPPQTPNKSKPKV